MALSINYLIHEPNLTAQYRLQRRHLFAPLFQQSFKIEELLVVVLHSEH